MSEQLYRHYNREGVLLYVGVSNNFLGRLKQHEHDAHWFKDIANTTAQHFGDRKNALVAEREAITAEKPLYNLQNRTGIKAIEIYTKRTMAQQARRGACTVVQFDPIYSITGLANMFGMKRVQIEHYMREGHLGYFEYDGVGTLQRRSTGWQVMSFIEWLEKGGSQT